MENVREPRDQVDCQPESLGMVKEYELTSPTPTCPPVCGRTELPATHFNFNTQETATY